jgi:hypothetical protein
LVPNKPNEEDFNTSRISLIRYEIVEKEDISYLGNPRMVYRIVLKIEKLPTKKELQEICTFLWKKGNQHYSDFTIFSYMPGMDTHSTAYGIAEFKPSGLDYIKVNKWALLGTKWGE